MIGMELIDKGTVVERGKGSRAVPIKKHIASMKGVEIGDPYEIYSEKGELIIRFPKTQDAPPNGEVF